jgi:hypothetical protein
LSAETRSLTLPMMRCIDACQDLAHVQLEPWNSLQIIVLVMKAGRQHSWEWVGTIAIKKTLILFLQASMNLIDSFRNSFRRFVDDWLFENRYHHIELPLEVEYEHRRSSAIIETRYVLQKRKFFFFSLHLAFLFGLSLAWARIFIGFIFELDNNDNLEILHWYRGRQRAVSVLTFFVFISEQIFNISQHCFQWNEFWWMCYKRVL